MAKKIKGVFFDKNTGKARKCAVENSLEAYYKLLDCSTIDIVRIRIGGEYFDIICDDEGALVDSPVVTMTDYLCHPMLVGNLFICKHDGNGNEVSLTEEQVQKIMKSVRFGHLVGAY